MVAGVTGELQYSITVTSGLQCKIGFDSALGVVGDSVWGVGGKAFERRSFVMASDRDELVYSSGEVVLTTALAGDKQIGDGGAELDRTEGRESSFCGSGGRVRSCGAVLTTEVVGGKATGDGGAELDRPESWVLSFKGSGGSSRSFDLTGDLPRAGNSPCNGCTLRWMNCECEFSERTRQDVFETLDAPVRWHSDSDPLARNGRMIPLF